MGVARPHSSCYRGVSLVSHVSLDHALFRKRGSTGHRTSPVGVEAFRWKTRGTSTRALQAGRKNRPKFRRVGRPANHRARIFLMRPSGIARSKAETDPRDAFRNTHGPVAATLCKSELRLSARAAPPFGPRACFYDPLCSNYLVRFASSDVP